MADLNKARKAFQEMIEQGLAKAKRSVPKYAEDVPILHEGAGPLAGSADDIPLQVPHVGNKELPISADSPEMARKVRQFMAERTVEGEPSKLAHELADEARPEATKRLLASEDEITATEPLQKVGLVERASKAAGLPQKKLLNFIAQKLDIAGPERESSEAASEIAERVADRLGVPAEGLPGILARTGLATATEFGLDPLSALPVSKIAQFADKGFKIAKSAKLAQKATGVLGEGRELAQKSVEAIARKMRANEAMNVLKLGRKKTLSTAEKLAQQGAERIVPRNVIPGRE